MFNSSKLFLLMGVKSEFVLLIIPLLIILSMFSSTLAFGNAIDADIVHTDKTLYHWGDTIVINGIIKNPGSEKYIIKIFDPVNTSPIVITQFIPKTNGSFSQIFLGVGPLWGLSGNYTAVLQSESKQLAETKFLFIANPRYGIVSSESKGNNTSNIILPPLVQIKSGIKVQDVKCMDDFILILKSKDGSPACVKPDTSKILVERGWAKPMLV